jgi:hypothetical protein
MIVWRITGKEIGPNGNGAYYFAKKKDAEKVLREHRAAHPDDGSGPEKIEVTDRDELVNALHDAMGYGASGPGAVDATPGPSIQEPL